MENSLETAGRTHKGLLSFSTSLLTLPVQISPTQCVSNGAEILSCLFLFILVQCLVSSLSRADRLVLTNVAEHIHRSPWISTTCHFLAAPTYPHTQPAHNWKPPTSVTFKSCMKNDWLAKSKSTWQLSSEISSLSEPGCDGWVRRGPRRRWIQSSEATFSSSPYRTVEWG